VRVRKWKQRRCRRALVARGLRLHEELGKEKDEFSMKRLIPFLLVAALGFAAGALTIARQLAARHTRELDAQRAAWGAEKTDLETDLASARAWRASPSPGAVSVAPQTPAAAKPTPEELLRRLAAMKVVPGPERTHAVRQILVMLDQLSQAGPEALPAIRQFLDSNADVEFDRLAEARVPRDIRALTDAVQPFSLRLALFDVVRQIGGDEAEQLLAETLGRTGRGLEIACLTQLLEEMAPGKYRDNALAAAQALLARGVADAADRLPRDYLFSVLRRFNDASFAATAQAQLAQADGRIDRGALRYLQQSLGEQSVAIAAQFYKDGRITDADSREPLARVALTYVGASEQASQLWHTAINDPALKPAQRRELILDLDQDGLQNDKTPTPADLPIVANRLALTQAYLQQDYVQNEPVLNKALLEVNQDLQKLLERGTAAAAANAAGATPTPRVK
jgi:hypothetical protein